MIKFFRKIRQNLVMENKTGKYFKYAIGEIILVVIGILIALQVNNWNENRIQEKELKDSLEVLASNIESDIKSLLILKSTRAQIRVQVDSVIKFYTQDEDGGFYHKINKIKKEQAVYYSVAFKDLRNTITFQPDLSVIDALKSTENFNNLQGTDLGKILNAYYSTTKHLQDSELKHNNNINTFYQEWDKTFRNKNIQLFQTPMFNSNAYFEKHFPEYENIANAYLTLSQYYTHGLLEADIIKQYDDLIQIGETIVEMVNNEQMNFDTDTKTNFESRSAVFTYPDVITMLVDGKLIPGFNFRFYASTTYSNVMSTQEGYITFNYPDNKLEWAAPSISVNALNGRMSHMDFSKYNALRLEMKGENGGETFEVIMKDRLDPPDGSESRIAITLTNEWKIYEFDFSTFKTADKTMIEIPLAFVFTGSEGRQIHVKTIEYR